MRTTVNLDDDLLLRAKHEAARSKRTLTSVIEDALRVALSSPAQHGRAPAQITTSPGRPLPGVDLDDTSALLDLMERDAAD